MFGAKTIRHIAGIIAVLAMTAACDATTLVRTPVQDRISPEKVVADAALSSGPELRAVLEAFPKGGDLHNHLDGAIYAETLLEWAVEDDLCVDPVSWGLRFPAEQSCTEREMLPASAVIGDEDRRRRVINAVSMRSFVPSPGWSGHNQFFSTFAGIKYLPHRFGDALAGVAARNARQNIQYLELMQTLVLGELIPLAGEVEMTGDPAEDYRRLMASSFGSQFEGYIERIGSEIEIAYARKDELLGCHETPDATGCDVKINIIHQVVRAFEPATVYAQIILGWEAMKRFDRVVALNLVAPEDGFVALRDYRAHMAMIDYLYKTQGARGVTLHAGELTLGLVRPDELTFHIKEAIETGHARRIGHGIDIAFEDDHEATLARMAEEGIMVEINLTSNDGILGIKGEDHPLKLYRKAGVPFALSTDDEGVSRGDLTFEYMRGVREQGLGYQDLVQSARNALTYSFMSGESLWADDACVADINRRAETPSGACASLLEESEKARQQWDYEQRRFAFEADLANTY